MTMATQKDVGELLKWFTKNVGASNASDIYEDVEEYEDAIEDAAFKLFAKCDDEYQDSLIAWSVLWAWLTGWESPGKQLEFPEPECNASKVMSAMADGLLRSEGVRSRQRA